MSEERYLYPENPARFVGEDINKILIHCEGLGFSDLHVLTDAPIYADIHGRKRPITSRSLNATEVADMVMFIDGPSAQAQLANGKPIDRSHDFPAERGKRLRYRVNAVGALCNGRDGIKMTLRAINPVPPTMEFLQLEKEIHDNFFPSQGIVLVTGATGSGKSTLMAGCIADLVAQAEAHKTIVMAESPIEYVYDTVEKPSSVLSQSEVPTHIPSFASAIENAMRQSPDIIVVGEMRDKESVSAAIMAAQTGHLVIGTAHTNGVPETVRRLVSVFPGSEQYMRQADIVEALRMIVTQRLVPTKDGKRTPAREYHIFTEEDRVEMSRCTPADIAAVTRDIVNKRGKPMKLSLQQKWEEGVLEESVYHSLMRGVGADGS